MADTPEPKDTEAARAQDLKEVFDRAVDLHRNGQLHEAETQYRIVLSQSPGSAMAWTNFGALLRKQGKFAQAIAAHRRALEIKPDLTNARANLANALYDFGEAEEAVPLREDLLAEDPDNWTRIRDLAVALRGCWRNQDCIDLVNAAEARLGANEPCRLQRALALLMLGSYGEGFRDFEARYSGDEVALPRNVPWPRWSGEPLSGKSILILPEQGLGDAILMARFLPALKAAGAEVSMVVKPPLRRLFKNLDGLDHMLDGVKHRDHFDFYTPNMSLPHLVGMPANGPPPLPMLDIPDDSKAQARTQVAPFDDRFKIGIVWTGSLTYRANHRRSTTPESFLGLVGIPGVQLFSLYKGDAHQELPDSGMTGLIVDACGEDRDFADTAALISEMDLMITTDTAVVHVAASLGKPVWNMLTHEGFWLYGSGETTPWYPSMRLFRQEKSEDWTKLFGRVQTALEAHLEERA